jgi:NAD(P)-dependent dehydrogenase (short-subunit alcohol dehydrogenase family)
MKKRGLGNYQRRASPADGTIWYSVKSCEIARSHPERQVLKMNDLGSISPFQLRGKVALVTGAGSGIGAEIARLFARQGATVVIGDVDERKGRAVSDGIAQTPGTTCLFQHLDVTDVASARQAVQASVDSYGGLHILVNNAGIGYVGDVLETDEQEFERLMAVNVSGVFHCSKAAVAWMVSHGGGIIVNIASVAGQVGVRRRFAYGTSKGAVIAMTKSMAVDLVDRGIRVNCICPGTVYTPFVDAYLDRFFADNREEAVAALHARQPLGRMGKPEEIAYAALYLASSEAEFATGSALVVDGGLTAQ